MQRRDAPRDVESSSSCVYQENGSTCPWLYHYDSSYLAYLYSAVSCQTGQESISTKPPKEIHNDGSCHEHIAFFSRSNLSI